MSGPFRPGDQPINWLYQFIWKDGAPHQVVMIGKSLGVGPVRQPWEGRWFRVFGRGYRGGAGVCDKGEWGLEEVTDPAEVALLEEYLQNVRSEGYITKPPYPLEPPLDPRLTPHPWR